MVCERGHKINGLLIEVEDNSANIFSWFPVPVIRCNKKKMGKNLNPVQVFINFLSGYVFLAKVCFKKLFTVEN